MVKQSHGAMVHVFLGLAELFLAARVVFHLFAANNANGFVSWVYTSSNILMQPFHSVFSTVTVAHDHTVDFAALFAMAAYGVVAVILLGLYARFGRMADGGK